LPFGVYGPRTGNPNDLFGSPSLKKRNPGLQRANCTSHQSHPGKINYYACLSGIKAQILPFLPQPAPEPSRRQNPSRPQRTAQLAPSLWRRRDRLSRLRA
jgi:hypothetical protein